METKYGDKIIAEREGNSWLVRYLLGLKSCGQVVSGQIRVYHTDKLGSVRVDLVLSWYLTKKNLIQQSNYENN